MATSPSPLTALRMAVARRLAPDLVVERAAPEFGRAATVSRGRSGGIGDSLFDQGLTVVYPRPDQELDWRKLDLDQSTFDKISPSDLIERLIDLSPEISRALWDHLRLMSSDWAFRAVKRGGTVDDPVIPPAQKALEAFFKQVGDQYGSIESLFNRIDMSAFLRGAMCAELVIADDHETPLTIVPIDCRSVRFRKTDIGAIGPTWEAGQVVKGDFIPFDRETIRYIPVDALTESPYGRAMILPAIFSSLFILSVMHDLRRVIQQQGYPRISIKLVEDQILNQIPPMDRAKMKQEDIRSYVNEAVEAIAKAYRDLQPDDAFFHTDGVEVEGKKGNVDASSLSQVDAFIGSLERNVTRALKTMPLMMGISEGGNVDTGNRQWEVHAAGIRSLIRHKEALLSHLATLAMTCQGISCQVFITFKELRASEAMRDAQTVTLKAAVAKMGYEQGWHDNDMAANMAFGYENAELPEPRVDPNKATGGELSGGQADNMGGNGTTGESTQDPKNNDATNSQAVRIVRSAEKIVPLRKGQLGAIRDARFVYGDVDAQDRLMAERDADGVLDAVPEVP